MDAVVVDSVRGLIEARRKQYKSATARTITVTNEVQKGLARGILEFGRKPASPEVRDYGSIRFETRALTVEAAIAFFDSLCRNETPNGYDFPMDGTVDLGIPHWASERRPSPIGGPVRVFPWPSLVFLLKPKQSKSMPMGPILKRGLPILSDVPDSADEWLGFDARTLSESHQSITLVLPDFRARIKDVVFAEREIRLGVEAGIVPLKNLELRASINSGSKWREPRVEASSDGFVIESAGIPSQLLAFLVVRDTDDLVDWANIHPIYGNLPPGVSFAIPEQRLAQLIADGENGPVEFKRLVDQPFFFVQSVVAFANTDGGKILIGVNDDGSIEGTEPEKMRPKLQEWTERYCDPPIELAYTSHTFDGRPVLVVDVPKGANRPYVLREKGVVYVRRGATDRPTHRAELDELYGRNADAQGQRAMGFR